MRRIIERDAADISALQRLGELPQLLKLLAARNATELTVAHLAADSGIPARTLGPYLDLLETLFLIHVDAGLFHYRDRDGAEVDLVIETKDGRVIGIEVKAASTISGRDVKWLAQMRDRLGDRFIGGFVLHTGPTTAPFGDRIVAVPISVPWAR